MDKIIEARLICCYLILITFIVGYDLLDEYGALADGNLIWHILLELVLLLLSICGILYLLKKSLAERSAKEKFLTELDEANLQLEKVSEQLNEGKRDFIKLINWQFNEWCLSPCEKEIGFFLLKGLSFDEIATIRNTSARTGRKQAASIYSKAGLHNRNEFAAWFLEDLL